ncbi:MAG: biotin/lipoate A/B protein ligase family protein [Thermoplasmata archaeon]
MTPHSPSEWRLVDSGIVSPEFSVAADEAILNARLREFVPNTLHFYVRNCPCVSIGYNMPLKESVCMDEVGKRNVRLVRRFSGGSAVYTDQGQLIFALIIDSSFLPSDLLESYKRICEAVIRGLSYLGIKAEHKPVNDIVVGGLKISGSAQLRRGGIVLHHGTIMVDTDLDTLAAVIKPTRAKRSNPPVSKRVTCLRELLGRAPDMREVKSILSRGISESFGVTLREGALTPGEISDTERLIKEKYSLQEWTWRL